jgi:hypothetical protein
MKIRYILISLAIVMAIGGALATKAGSKADYCDYLPQYHKVGSTYVPAGEFGYNYYCWDLGGVCTYYKPNPFVEVYYPCKTGEFETIYP